MPENKPNDQAPEEPGGSRFPDLEELQQEIERRIRDNQKFLERFLDEAFVEEEEEAGEEEDGEEER
ncbi:MAG: hypothetical protein IH614_07520 [Desulfuromonadales bacterium]|nr:hypothetical protein [Desulfuromonadales bacterium]